MSRKITFRNIDPSDAAEVAATHAWHHARAKNDPYLLPRTEDGWNELAENGQVYGAFDDAGAIVGLCYYADWEGDWEIGGLMVDDTLNGNGIGSTLFRLSIIQVLAIEDPLPSKKLIAHVHEDNWKPRGIIGGACKFDHVDTQEFDGAELPGLKQNAAGKIVGMLYAYNHPDTLNAIAHWLDKWNDELRDGTPAEIAFAADRAPSDLAKVIRDMV